MMSPEEIGKKVQEHKQNEQRIAGLRDDITDAVNTIEVLTKTLKTTLRSGKILSNNIQVADNGDIWLNSMTVHVPCDTLNDLAENLKTLQKVQLDYDMGADLLSRI